MAASAKKRRIEDGDCEAFLAGGLRVFSSPPSAPATVDDKHNWNGFCEIESEPVSQNNISVRVSVCLTNLAPPKAFFNTILKELGVSGVKVQEVVSLDPEMLVLLPYVNRF